MENVIWGRFALAILAAAIASSITDWLFFGVLFHDKYLTHPEVWRGGAGGTETKKIVLSTVLGAFSCAVFILLLAGLGFHTYTSTIKLAILVWLIGALPTVLTYHLFVKLNPALILSHSLGYLARLMLAGVAYLLIAY